METRSRKRAEATSHRPSPATPSRSKRARVSANSTSSASASFAPPRSRPSTRAQAPATPVSVPSTSVSVMDSGLDSSASGSKRTQDKGSKKEPEKEEDRLADKEKENKDREAEKGKEKEPDKEKERTRDRDRALAAASAGDDDHDGEGGSSLHQNLASASSALHGLLRKLGAGLDDLLPSSTPSSHQNSRLKRILSGLRAEGEEGRQLDSLSQLCELLSIGTEESLSSFSVDSFVPVLVGLLNYEYNPDMMLLAARALTHLCDVLPSSCAAVVHYGAVPCFCARLLTIEYIDLAEQSLQALEKISHEHPTACLRAGTLIAVLSYLDFFSTGVQRVAVSTAANICRQLPSDASDFVTEAVPILTNLLQYQDAKVVEHASVCLTRIAESFAASPEKLDTLCSHGLIPQTARLISVGNSSGSLVPQTSLSTSTFTGLIRLLSTCASGSAAAAESLLLLRISSILKDILAGAGLVSCTSVSPPSVNRPPEQLYEIVNLVNELLPPMPDSVGTSGVSTSNGGNVSRALRKYSTVTNPSKSEDAVQGSLPDVGVREKLLREKPELLVQFGVDLCPVLVQVYGSSVNPPVRQKCLAATHKLLHFSTPEMLRSLLKESNISSFLAGVLASKDAPILITALQIAEMLMQKLRDVFSKVFVKEGVVHAIDVLIVSESVLASPPPQASAAAGKSGDASTSAAPAPPTRPRRGGSGRRRPSGNNNEVAALEELGGSSATPVGSPPGSSGEPGFRTIRSGLRAGAIAAAKRFKESYFSGDSGLADAGVTESLYKLKNLCAKINGDVVGEVKGKGKGKAKAVGATGLTEEQLSGLMLEILAELGGEDGVSTFEFVGSGVVGSLLNYFACGTSLKDTVHDAYPAQLRQDALRRFKEFIDLSLPTAVAHGKEAPLTMLVRKLQNALSSLERFPVVLSHTPRSSSGSASIAAGLSALTQPFKLRLSRASSEKTLRDYSSNIVLIEPLATLIAVEDFLWPRVKRHESAFASTALSTSDATNNSTAIAAPTPSTSAPVSIERRPSTRSRSTAAVVTALGNKEVDAANISSIKGKGKAISRATVDLAEEHRGPETRNAAARRRAAAVGGSTVKHAGGGFGPPSESEDEEVDASPVEIEEALAMEEDDISEEEEEDEEDHEEDDDLEDGQAEEKVFGEEPAPLCIGERVHDVQLGDGVDGGTMASTSAPSTEMLLHSPGFSTGVAGVSVSGKGGLSTTGAEITTFRTGVSVGTKGPLSFAAAAMAGMASASGNGSRTGSRGSSANSPPKLIFSLGGKQLNRSLTIFQAIQRQAVADDDDEERYGGPDYPLGGGRRLWDEVYTITYRRADSLADQSPGAPSSTSGASPATVSRGSRVVANNPASEDSWQQASLLDSILQGELPCDLDKSNSTYDILLLLRILEGLNRLTPRLRTQGAADLFAAGKIENIDDLQVAGPLVPMDEFLSSKLTPKLARQMQDALALCSGGLPAWCHQLTRACPFLFPFETRRQYFHSTAFGLSRALQRLQQQQSADGAVHSNDRELRVGRLQRQKVRVSRNRILDSAAKVMELYSGHKAVLEVEYFGEVGTGLGPTLEFYTLLSHELQKSSLEMWRSDSSRRDIPKDVDMPDAEEGGVDNSYSAVGLHNPSTDFAIRNEEYVHAPYGLFPRPWPVGSDMSGNSRYSKVIEHFRLLGRVMAKALQDGRLLDLPLSKGFYKLVLGQELDCYDIQCIDPELGRTLQEMQLLVRRKQFLEKGDSKSRNAIESLTLRGSKIQDLCLDFTLPGQSDYALKPGGSEQMVVLENLEEYVSLVVDATVKSGISQQMEAFRAGFNQVFQLSTLKIFNEDELDSLLCGRRELWVSESLADLMKFDHGYTASSPPIRNLLEIMGEFTPDEQRAFLRFVTGAPRLPPGGLSSLSPKLTIVRKHPTGVTGTATAVLGSTPPGAVSGLGTTLADGDLPSVMTCANYLKLPPYSCKEVMRERLVFAILEGQGSFDLS